MYARRKTRRTAGEDAGLSLETLSNIDGVTAAPYSAVENTLKSRHTITPLLWQLKVAPVAPSCDASGSSLMFYFVVAFLFRRKLIDRGTHLCLPPSVSGREEPFACVSCLLSLKESSASFVSTKARTRQFLPE